MTPSLTYNGWGPCLVNLDRELQFVQLVGELHDGLVLHGDKLDVGGDILVHLADLLLQQLSPFLQVFQLGLQFNNGLVLIPSNM